MCAVREQRASPGHLRAAGAWWAWEHQVCIYLAELLLSLNQITESHVWSQGHRDAAVGLI